jgi:branched-chain amino acid transport system ATP-binding protein
LEKAILGTKRVSEPQLEVTQNDKLLVADGLEVSYGSTQVLWGVSLSVAKGKVTCIIGSNGAGKTTSLNTIAGMLRAKKGPPDAQWG